MIKKLLFPVLLCLVLALPAHASLTKGTDSDPGKRKITVPQVPKEHLIVIRTAKDPKVNQVKVGTKGEILIPQSTALAGAALAGAAHGGAAAVGNPVPSPAGAGAGALKGAEAGDDAKSGRDSKKEDSGFKSASGASGIGGSKTSDLSSGANQAAMDSGILGGGAVSGLGGTGAGIPIDTGSTQNPLQPWWVPTGPTTFTITASAGDHGTISPAGTVSVTSGVDQSFAITPSKGYLLANILVDDTPVPVTRSFTFSNVTTNHKIKASFISEASLQNLVKQSVSDTEIPGAVVAMQTAADTWIGAAGKSDLGDVTGNPQNMPADPVKNPVQVRLAGVTRLLTATLIMKLNEGGYFQTFTSTSKTNPLDNSLEDLLSSLLGPGAIPSGDRITVRMLLNHTSGLHDHETTQEFFSGLISFPSLFWDPFADLLPLIQSYPTLNFTPGTDFKFCSTDYYLLGVLAGTVAGNLGDLDPLQQVQAEFFSGLNLNSTSLTISGLFDQVNPFARTYYWPGIPEFPTLTDTTDWDLSFDWTNGCGISTAQDILNFTQALFVDKTVFSFPDDPDKVQYDAFLEQMTTPNGPTNAQGQPLPYGFGLEVVNPDPWFGEKAYKSDGGTTGAYARWLYYPKSGRTIFIAFNRADKRFNTDPPLDPLPTAPQVDAAQKADDLLKAVSNALKTAQ